MLEENGLPSNIRVPGAYFGVDDSLAGTFQSQDRLLVFGQKLVTGTAMAGVVSSVLDKQEGLLFGEGSMLATMIEWARKNNPTAEIWAMPLDDDGTQSVWTVTVSGAPLVTPEVIMLMVAGDVYRVTVNIDDTNDDIAAAFVTAINANTQAPVIASAAGAVLTLTAKHAGAVAGQLDVRTQYRRRNLTVSTQISLTVAQTVVGAGAPDCDAVLANLSEEQFKWVLFPYNDLSNLAAITAEFNDTVGRWSALRQLRGHIVSAVSGTTTERFTLGQALNSQHLSMPGIYGSPTPPYLIAAEVAAIVHRHLSGAPELSRPLQTLELQCTLPPEVEDVDDVTTKNVLYHSGIGGFRVTSDGKVAIERLLTTYQKNKWGAPTNSYLDIQTLAQLMYLIEYLNFKITQTFPRAALKDDDAFTPPGTNVVTPRRMKDYLAIWGSELGQRLVIEDVERFVSLLEVVRDPDDVNALLIWVRPDLVNQFRIAKVLVQFMNEYPAGLIVGIENNGGVQ